MARAARPFLDQLRVRRQAGRTALLRRPADVDAALTDRCRCLAAQLGLPKLGERVAVRWNSRMRTTAGRAWWPDRLIELNPKMHEFGADEVERTLLHELAHLIAYERCGRRRIQPHGAEWRQACADLGIDGESATHSLPLRRARQKRRYAYDCPHCGAAVQRVRRITWQAACATCCAKFSGGVYDNRFQLIERKI